MQISANQLKYEACSYLLFPRRYLHSSRELYARTKEHFRGQRHTEGYSQEPKDYTKRYEEYAPRCDRHEGTDAFAREAYAFGREFGCHQSNSFKEYEEQDEGGQSEPVETGTNGDST